jgi:hypothetical protein
LPRRRAGFPRILDRRSSRMLLLRGSVNRGKRRVEAAVPRPFHRSTQVSTCRTICCLCSISLGRRCLLRFLSKEPARPIARVVLLDLIWLVLYGLWVIGQNRHNGACQHHRHDQRYLDQQDDTPHRRVTHFSSGAGEEERAERYYMRAPLGAGPEGPRGHLCKRR